MSFKFLRFRLPTMCRSYFVMRTWALFACLLSSVISAAPGQLDTAFGDLGLARADVSGSIDNRVPSMLLLRDGRIVVAGTCLRSTYGLCVTRWSAEGLLDASFASNTGQAFATACAWSRNVWITEQLDGKLIVVASGDAQNSSGGDICVLRFTADGVLDSSFGNSGRTFLSINDQNEYPTALTTLSDGRMLIVSSCELVVGAGPTSRAVYGCAFMLNANGSLDSGFGNAGVAALYFGLPSTRARLLTSIIERPDGSILIGGTCGANGGVSTVFCAGRLTTSGQFVPVVGNNFVLAASLGLTIRSSDPSNVFGRTIAQIALGESGELYVAGTCYSGSDDCVCVVRLNANGTPDSTFNGLGYLLIPMGSTASGSMNGFSLQQDGKILVTASFSTAPFGVYDLVMARVDSNGLPDPSFGIAGVARITSFPANQTIEPLSAQLLSNGNLLVGGGCRPIGGDFSLSARHCVVRIDGGPYPTQVCALNADANLVTAPASDALLLTRYLLGLRGDALTNGALGTNPTRTGQALETYLASLDLDVDGDGQALATTDGLLLIRAMLGLTGDALTAGATNVAHPNVRNAQQILSWIESTHGVACLP
jgi:uncharacterized delta-60 repeat protein